jgi:hypothetical protein
MPTTLKTAAGSYLRAKALSRGTRNEYLSTLRKWERWGGGIPIEQLRRKDIREFLDRVYEQAVTDEGENPGRTANKAREHIRAVLYWAWEQELIDTLPRFPAPRDQRDVAGRHYLTKAEINALYFATHKMARPRGWDAPYPIGRYWRSPGRVLQLRRRHRDRLGVHAGSRAHPLAPCDLGSEIAGP